MPFFFFFLRSLESNRGEETEPGSDEPEEVSETEINQTNDFSEVFSPSRECTLFFITMTLNSGLSYLIFVTLKLSGMLFYFNIF